MLDRFMYAAVIPAYRSLPERFALIDDTEDSAQEYINYWNENSTEFGKARLCRVRVTEMPESEDIFPDAEVPTH